MTAFNWQLQSLIDTVVFDCDGTLSVLEGIDELAKKNGVGEEVKALTAVAMGQTGLNPDIYAHRLSLVKPTRSQVLAQGEEYFQNVVLDAVAVIKIFQRLQKNIFIMSAGLQPAVMTFGGLLGVPPENIFAVPIEFDDRGEFKNYDPASPFAHKEGKRVVLAGIQHTHPDVVYVGDGLNDFAVYDMVKRFVGYGGAFYHEKLAAHCQFYIKTQSMAPLLPLVLTEDEAAGLTLPERFLYAQGLEAILAGYVNVG